MPDASCTISVIFTEETHLEVEEEPRKYCKIFASNRTKPRARNKGMIGDSDTICRKSFFLIYILMINYKHLKSKHMVCLRVGNAQ